MKQIKKRGFTLVELVIVIAVIAVLAAVLIPTFVSVVENANQSADQQLIRNLNTALRVGEAEEGKNHTMYDALQDAKDAGYDIAKINASATNNEILWDQANDCFVYYNAKNTAGNRIEYLPELAIGEKLTDNGSNTYKLWKIYGPKDTVPETQTYSIYWNRTDVNVPEEVTVGFDAGETIGIKEVQYTNNTAGRNDLVIRTNSFATTLNINAENDTVYHYGSVGEANIEKVAMDCYYECGNAAYVEVSAGKVVAKDGGQISVVFTAATEASQVAVTTENGTIAQGFATDPSVLSASDLTFTQVTASESGLPEEVQTAKKTAQDTALEEERQEIFSEYNYWIGSAAKSFEGGNGTPASPYEIATAEQLARLAMLMNGSQYKNYIDKSYKLTADIDLSGKCWVPIANMARKQQTDHYFTGTFDGNDQTIKGLNSIGLDMSLVEAMANGSTPVDGEEYVYGLFGCINGATIENVQLAEVDIRVGDGSQVAANGTRYLSDTVGALVGYIIGDATICDITVSGFVSGYDVVGGIAGRVVGGAVTFTNCTNNADITAVRRSSGLLGYIQAYSFTSEENAVTIGYSNNSAKFTGCANSGKIQSLGWINDYAPDRNKNGTYCGNYYGACVIAHMAADQTISEEKNQSYKACTNTGSCCTVINHEKTDDKLYWFYATCDEISAIQA